MASALAIVLLAALLIPIMIYAAHADAIEDAPMTHRGALALQHRVSVVLGLAFLYLPIVILVIYSFNNSRSVAVWGGWSLRWYRELLNDSAMLEAAWVSLRIALVSATAATILGTLAAVALARVGRFRGRLAFSALMVMRRW